MWVNRIENSRQCSIAPLPPLSINHAAISPRAILQSYAGNCSWIQVVAGLEYLCTGSYLILVMDTSYAVTTWTTTFPFHSACEEEILFLKHKLLWFGYVLVVCDMPRRYWPIDIPQRYPFYLSFSFLHPRLLPPQKIKTHPDNCSRIFKLHATTLHSIPTTVIIPTPVSIIMQQTYTSLFNYLRLSHSTRLLLEL